MNRPVVIVDPRSSGIELAPSFKAQRIPAIAVTLEPIKQPHKRRLGFGTEVQTDDFSEIIPDQPNLIEILKSHNPFAIIPGAEGGVPLANRLSAALTPQFSNNSQKPDNSSTDILHKAYMQQALQKAGVPSIKTLNTSSIEEAESWLKEFELADKPLIIKPPISAGSDKVFHISATENWKVAFNRVLTEPSVITGETNETAIIQEQVIGTEFAVGTVSADGKHYLAHLIKYNKASCNGRETIFDHVEFVPYAEDLHGELFNYTKKALDALGVRWGAAHNEVMLTEKGPRLIESSPRMCGGPVVGFAREATGSSQADKLVEAYVEGDVTTKEYVSKKTVIPVFLKSSTDGIVANAEVFDAVSHLPTLFKKYIWFENGDHVPQTVDYLTSIGIIALTGSRDSIYRDIKKIREMESQLIITPF